MEWLALNHAAPVALATVIATRGSTPRHVGARMVVAADGATWGTIGGGRIEVEVTAAARAVAAGAPARRVAHHLVRDLAMCCGGWMDVLVAPLAGAEAARDALAAAAAARELALLITPLDGGPLVVRPATAAHPADALVEVVAPPERAIVFGAGHVGRALGPILASCGWQVVLCDDGETGALDALGAPAWAAVVVDAFDVDVVERAVGRLGAGDYALIVTRDHAVDQRLLEALVGNPALAYLGMIGSRGKVGRFRKRLEAKGLLTPDFATRVRAPVGLDVGAETPAEIAVAIVAELIAVRRRGAPAAGAWAGRPHEHLADDAEATRG